MKKVALAICIALSSIWWVRVPEAAAQAPSCYSEPNFPAMGSWTVIHGTTATGRVFSDDGVIEVQKTYGTDYAFASLNYGVYTNGLGNFALATVRLSDDYGHIVEGQTATFDQIIGWRNATVTFSDLPRMKTLDIYLQLQGADDIPILSSISLSVASTCYEPIILIPTTTPSHTPSVTPSPYPTVTPTPTFTFTPSPTPIPSVTYGGSPTAGTSTATYWAGSPTAGTPTATYTPGGPTLTLGPGGSTATYTPGGPTITLDAGSSTATYTPSGGSGGGLGFGGGLGVTWAAPNTPAACAGPASGCGAIGPVPKFPLINLPSPPYLFSTTGTPGPLEAVAGYATSVSQYSSSLSGTPGTGFGLTDLQGTPVDLPNTARQLGTFIGAPIAAVKAIQPMFLGKIGTLIAFLFLVVIWRVLLQLFLFLIPVIKSIIQFFMQLVKLIPFIG